MNDQAAGLRKMMKKTGNKEEGARTRIIAVASGKGGVGKSNISVNLGLALQEMGKEVLLVDADLGMANIDILLGLTPKYNLSHILKGKCDFDDAVLQAPGGLNVLPGTSGVEDLVNISLQEINRLLAASSQMERDYDIIMIDIGAGIHRSVINFIMAADEAIIVLTPEPTAVMDAYSLIKVLANHNFKSKLGLLINQVNSKQEASRVTERMSSAINKYLKLDVNLLGSIPYDLYVQKSVKKQLPVLTQFPNSKAGQAFTETASKLIEGNKNTQARGMKGFIYRIVGMFNRT